MAALKLPYGRATVAVRLHSQAALRPAPRHTLPVSTESLLPRKAAAIPLSACQWALLPLAGSAVSESRSVWQAQKAAAGIAMLGRVFPIMTRSAPADLPGLKGDSDSLTESTRKPEHT